MSTSSSRSGNWRRGGGSRRRSREDMGVDGASNGEVGRRFRDKIRLGLGRK